MTAMNGDPYNNATNRPHNLESEAASNTPPDSAIDKSDASLHDFFHSPDAFYSQPYSQPKADELSASSHGSNSSSDHLTDREKGIVLSGSSSATRSAYSMLEELGIIGDSHSSGSRPSSLQQSEYHKAMNHPSVKYDIPRRKFDENFTKAEKQGLDVRKGPQARQPDSVGQLRGIIVETNAKRLAYSPQAGFVLIPPDCALLAKEKPLRVGELIVFDAEKFLEIVENVYWLATSVKPLAESTAAIEIVSKEPCLTLKVKAIILRVSMDSTAWLWNDMIGRIRVKSRAFRVGMEVMDAVECVCQYNESTHFGDAAFTAVDLKLLNDEEEEDKAAENNKAVHAAFGQLLITEDKWKVSRVFHSYGYLRHLENGSTAFFTRNDVTSGNLLPAEGEVCRVTAVRRQCDTQNAWRAVLVSPLDPRSKQPIYTHPMSLENEKSLGTKLAQLKLANHECWDKKWQVENRGMERTASYSRSFAAMASKLVNGEGIGSEHGACTKLLPKDVKQWTVDDVERWVDMLTYPEKSYGSKFSEEEINGPALLELEQLGIQVVKDVLGIPLGPAINLLTAIKKLTEQQ